jgi:SAM-dependent methyltransferase
MTTHKPQEHDHGAHRHQAPVYGHSHEEHGHGHNHDGHAHGGYNPSSLQRSDAFYQPVYEQIINWLNVQPGSKVLDAGSGTGIFTELLASAGGDSCSVTALDVSEDLLGVVRQRLEGSPLAGRVEFQLGDITDLPLDDTAYDLVWSSRTIHHLPDQVAGLRELWRVLKPHRRLALREGGLPSRLLPVDPGVGRPGLEDRLQAHFQEWFAVHVRSGEGAVDHPYGWTQMLRDAGFSNVIAKSFLVELLPPFNDNQTAYMRGQLARWAENEERRTLLSPDDAEAIEQLIDPEGEHYAFRRMDLHYLEVVSVYVGEA